MCLSCNKTRPIVTMKIYEAADTVDDVLHKLSPQQFTKKSSVQM